MIKEFVDIFMNSRDEFTTAVIIMVSAVIVLMGILKSILFNRIKNKSVRCVVLSFSSLALMFATLAVFFVINGFDFKWYLLSGTVVSCIMIVTYWLYENTKLRDAIHKIGSFVITKLFNKIVTKVNDVAEGTELLGNAIDDLLKNGKTKTSETNEKSKDDLKKL